MRALLRDRFPVMQHLATGDVPVTVIYGDHVSVVPTVLSARVANHAPSLAERLVIVGADHNDPVMLGPRVRGLRQSISMPLASAADWRRPGDRRFPLTCAKTRVMDGRTPTTPNIAQTRK